MLALTYLSVALEGALAFRLIFAGLARSFRWFTAYLLLLFARDWTALRFVPRNTKLYEQVWAWSGLLLLALQACVVFESYARVRSQIPDLGKWGRRFLAGACIAAAVAALSTTWIDLSRPLQRSLTQAVYTLPERNMGMALAIIAVLSVLIFRPFRVRLRPNTVVHSTLLALYLGLNALIFGLMNLELVRRRTAGFSILITAIVCYLVWTFRLSRRGEVVPVQLDPLSAQERETLASDERSLLQVERVTQDLARGAARRPRETP